MTGRTTRAAGVAVLASIAIHGALLARIVPNEGGTQTPQGTAEISMLGQSFEQVAGRLAPVRPEPAARAIRPVQPTPSRTATVAADPPDAPPPTAAPVAADVAAEVIPSTPATAASDPATPAERVRPMAATTPGAEPERITARDAPAARTPTDATPRPQARPSRPAPPPPEGNAERSTTAGTRTGQTEGTAPRPQGDPEAAPGPSARDIARYPQQVNRHLARLRRPAGRLAGTAVVGFTIAPSGGLAAIGILRSSGDAGFDDLALRHIRRAVPFPAPPEGAQTQYSVAVRGR